MVDTNSELNLFPSEYKATKNKEMKKKEQSALILDIEITQNKNKIGRR